MPAAGGGTSADGAVEQTLASLLDDGLFIDGDWIESKDQDPNGEVRLIQTSQPAGLKGDKNTELLGISVVRLRAEWSRNGIEQSRKIEFYVYRNG